jgi:hypothetical protein
MEKHRRYSVRRSCCGAIADTLREKLEKLAIREKSSQHASRRGETPC